MRISARQASRPPLTSHARSKPSLWSSRVATLESMRRLQRTEIVEVDVATVEDLLQRRQAARARGEYELADELRAELSSLGVEVFDAERVWRASRWRLD